MKQVVQANKGGAVELVDSPVPTPSATELLIRTQATVISAGTERFATQLAQSSLLGKAKARPDLVRQVVDKARKEGIKSTLNAVRVRLDDDLLLGYSGVGEVIAIGEYVRGFRPGQLVATAGSGYACHAEYQVVPQTLCAVVPDGVSPDHAAFSTIASIAMHGLRLADVSVGAKVVVVGLGLIGQLAGRLAMAAGCDVFGVDVNPAAVARAEKVGMRASLDEGAITTNAIIEWSRGRGADAVLITAGASGDSRIIRATPERCRDRAVVVAVGDVGLDLERNAFYHKELRLEVARSYGPGRYDPSYEEWAVDYPAGYVRWTEGRNLEAALDLMANRRLPLDDLISHRFPIDQAVDAFALLDQPSAGVVGIVLEYAQDEVSEPVAEHGRLRPPQRRLTAEQMGVGLCGSGLFMRGTLIPSLRAAGFENLVHVSSASGISAARLAQREGIDRSSSGIKGMLADPDVDLVVIATPHSSHARLTVQALDAGKHVYVEKPLALSFDELDAVEAAAARAAGLLHVGFNRRWSPMVVEAQRALRGSGPMSLHYRINAGPLSPGHWYADRREGGRLLGEVCHFIDTCNAIVGAAPVGVHCFGPNLDLHDSYTLLLEYADGSAATIGYAADGHTGTAKERLEILGRNRTLVIDDYRRLTLDGATVKVESGKGHVEALTQFRAAILRPTSQDTWHESAIATTRSALRANQARRRDQNHFFDEPE